MTPGRPLEDRYTTSTMKKPEEKRLKMAYRLLDFEMACKCAGLGGEELGVNTDSTTNLRSASENTCHGFVTSAWPGVSGPDVDENGYDHRTPKVLLLLYYKGHRAWCPCGPDA